jgi:hypothetical protein
MLSDRPKGKRWEKGEAADNDDYADQQANE